MIPSNMKSFTYGGRKTTFSEVFKFLITMEKAKLVSQIFFIEALIT